MKPIENKQMADYIVDTIKNQILSGKLKDGIKLTQQEIAQQTNLSRMPVREALQILEQEGFLKRLPNRHVAVIGVSQKTISSTFQIMSAIEAEMIQLIIRNKCNISALRSTMNKLEYDIHKQNNRAKQTELDFHHCLAETIENDYMNTLHTKLVHGYLAYAIRHFNRLPEDIIKPLQRIVSDLEEKHLSTQLRNALDTYYSALTKQMIKGGNYDK